MCVKFYRYGHVFTLTPMSLLSACGFLVFCIAVGEEFPVVKGHWWGDYREWMIFGESRSSDIFFVYFDLVAIFKETIQILS
jgi:hypothetical protein